MDTIDKLIEEITAQIKEQFRIANGIEAELEKLENDRDKVYVKIAHLRNDLSSLKRTKELAEGK